jgi:hypothetical protein
MFPKADWILWTNLSGDLIIRDNIENTYPLFIGASSRNYSLCTRSTGVGIFTNEPQYELDVEGTVQAHEFITGDITFQKDGKKLWRMFEDEKGLYVENLSTGKTSKVFLEDDLRALIQKVDKMEKEIEDLKSR